MKIAAIALLVYIVLILFQPAYMHVANLFCNSCSNAMSCSKQSASCPAKTCAAQKPMASSQNNNIAHVTLSCSACNPFLVCSGAGFVFSPIQAQQYITFEEKQIAFSADEIITCSFIHEMLHPPEYS
jgi:hypothetical protein